MASDNQPVRGFAVLTVGADGPMGRLFVVNASVAGNVTVKLQDNSTHTFPVPAGYSAYPYQVRQVTATTATAVYSNGL
jgi:hypothetical protein